MANIMNPVFPVGGIEYSAPPVKTSQASGDKFSDHLDRKIHDQRAHNDKVGVRQRQEKHAAKENGSSQEAPSEKAVKPQRDQDGDAAATLALFMQDLQQVSQDNGLGVGEWVASIENEGFLEGLAAHAGMSEVDLMALTEQFQGADGSLDLAAFFQDLQTHFEDFETDLGVLVPETELPLLESLLTKMGLSSEQLARISEKIVAGDGQIDLAQLTEALTVILNSGVDSQQPLQPITLSGAEVQQLQDLLAKAGLNLGEQLELLPESLLGKDVVLSVERLQSMLEQGVNEAKLDFPKVDLVAFLRDLESVMQGAKFVDQSAGITPLVQNSLGEVYKNLLDMFEKVQERFDQGLALDETMSFEDMEKWRTGVAERLAKLTGMDHADITVQAGLGSETQQTSSSASSLTSSGVAVEHAATTPVSGQPLSVEQSSQQGGAGDQPQPVRHFSSQQQQQIFNQLSLAVARGMKSGEHHLTLRLHPVELGDVKVDLIMKGDEISAHFNIANSKVKETLETSMDEFRQEMEQKGFTLGELNVSVGNQDDPNETWQRFEMAWSGERLQAETLEDLPDGALYLNSLQEQYANPEQGVNLFV